MQILKQEVETETAKSSWQIAENRSRDITGLTPVHHTGTQKKKKHSKAK